MIQTNINDIFTKEVLNELLPPHLSDQFFEALYGDADEGAYDISLAFKSYDPVKKKFSFVLELRERPGKCLVCNLTYGLPQVFSRHPLLNMQGLVAKIVALLDPESSFGWELGHTQTPEAKMHSIPLSIWLG